jgi:hypothetical protein
VRVASILALAVFAGLTASASAMRVGGATAVATPHTAGAKPARLTISLSLELRCAKPGPAPITVSLPRAWQVPKTVARSAVRIGAALPDAVTISGHTVTLRPATPSGWCTVIAPGTITVKFTRAAGLGNPRNVGRYTVRASIGAQTFSASVSITPA